MNSLTSSCKSLPPAILASFGFFVHKLQIYCWNSFTLILGRAVGLNLIRMTNALPSVAMTAVGGGKIIGVMVMYRKQ